MNNEELLPTNAAIITTYKCTAACKECCFECSPSIPNNQISVEEMKLFIDQISEYQTIKILVWSGGECFLIRKDLLEGITYAKAKGIPSRCVTNGYWAKNIERATEVLLPFKRAGLTEINFSTGDSHQKFISVDKILYGVIAALKLGLTVAISVETTKNNEFLKDDLLENNIYKQYIAGTEYEKHLIVSSSIWVSFHDDTQFEYDNQKQITKDGCTSIFDTVALEPTHGLVGCCGLTVGDISEMHLGRLSTDTQVKELFATQYNDFLKIWIYTDGPDYILDKAREWEPSLVIPKFHHRCLSCAYIYNTEEIKQVISQNYERVIATVLSDFQSKIILRKQAVLLGSERG